MTLPFTGPDYTLNIYQGAEFSWSNTYTTTDYTATPPVTSPVSLSAYTAHSQIRAQAAGWLLLDISSYVTLQPNGSTGEVLINIPGSVTATLQQPGTWDLFLVLKDSGWITLYSGAAPAPLMLSPIALYSGAVNLTLADTDL